VHRRFTVRRFRESNPPGHPTRQANPGSFSSVSGSTRCLATRTAAHRPVSGPTARASIRRFHESATSLTDRPASTRVTGYGQKASLCSGLTSSDRPGCVRAAMHGRPLRRVQETKPRGDQNRPTRLTCGSAEG
jgi:hypothetical protein